MSYPEAGRHQPKMFAQKDNIPKHIFFVTQTFMHKLILPTDTFSDNGSSMEIFGQRSVTRLDEELGGVGYICTRSALDVTCAVGTSYHEAIRKIIKIDFEPRCFLKKVWLRA